MQDLSVFLFDIVSRIMWFLKLCTHLVIVCTRNLNPQCYGTLQSEIGYELFTSKLFWLLLSNCLLSLILLKGEKKY